MPCEGLCLQRRKDSEPKGGLDLFGAHQGWAEVVPPSDSCALPSTSALRPSLRARPRRGDLELGQAELRNVRQCGLGRPLSVAGHQHDASPACLSKPSPVTGSARTFAAASSSQSLLCRTVELRNKERCPLLVFDIRFAES